VRSNVIVGFPGETAADVEELERFLAEARLDAIGVFGYSDEDGTEAQRLPGKVAEREVARRVERLSSLAEELTAQRAEDRIGERVDVLVESVHDGVVEGRGDHQAPEVDGAITLTHPVSGSIGDIVVATVVGTDGVDLIATARPDRRTSPT
jgi:tRNA A37 methylthiotransferase MiaB